MRKSTLSSLGRVVPQMDVIDIFGNARSRHLAWSYISLVALMVATQTDPPGDKDKSCH